MPRIQLSDYLPRLDDIELARELGRSLWESDTKLDFSGVGQVPESFLSELLTTILERRDQAALLNIVETTSMEPAVMNAFMGALLTLNTQPARPPISPQPPIPVSSPPPSDPPQATRPPICCKRA